MMKRIATLAVALFTIGPFNYLFASSEKYQIIGTVTGFRDSTQLLLVDLLTSNIIDSSLIVNDQFQFTGSLKNSPTQVAIKTADFRKYKYLWLENTTIHFTADKEKFNQAVIAGSKTQDESNVLNATLESIRKERNTLNEKYYADTSAKARATIALEFDKLDTKETEAQQLFIKEHLASIVSANLLNVYATTWGKETVSVLYAGITVENKNTVYGKEIAEFLALNKSLKIGDSYIDFSQIDNTGRKVSVSDFKGKVVLLEFWASWCFGCVTTNPELVKIYSEFKNKGFEILGISLDNNKEAWQSAIEKYGLTWPNVSELNGSRNKAALIYGVSAIPDNFLIDKDGEIIAKNLTGQELEETLKKHLD